MPSVSTLVADLKARVTALETPSRGNPGVLPFGVGTLDAVLPGGGLKCGAAHEVAAGPGAETHAAAATLFTAAIAARMEEPCLWITPTRDLFAPGLAGVGLTPDKLLIVEARDMKGVAALIEEGLRCAALGCVVGEVRGVSLAQSRRLQLAAEAGGVTAILLQRWAAADDAPSAMTTRWRIMSAPSAPLSVAGIGRARMLVELRRCRGAEGRTFIMEAPDAEGRLALVPRLEHRSPDRLAAAA